MFLVIVNVVDNQNPIPKNRVESKNSLHLDERDMCFGDYQKKFYVMGLDW